MNICPHCGTGSPDPEFCLECGVKIEQCRHPEEDALPDRELRGRSVYKALDEISAMTMAKILEAEGIHSWLQLDHAPDAQGLLHMLEGYWGTVMVYEDQEVQARNVIEDYLKRVGPGLH